MCRDVFKSTVDIQVVSHEIKGRQRLLSALSEVEHHTMCHSLALLLSSLP